MSSWLGEQGSGGFSLPNRSYSFSCCPSVLICSYLCPKGRWVWILCCSCGSWNTTNPTPEIIYSSHQSRHLLSFVSPFAIPRGHCGWWAETGITGGTSGNPAFWARSLWQQLNERVQHSDLWQKALANWVLIKQLIKFHLVNFPRNKTLIIAKRERFWALQQDGTETTVKAAGPPTSRTEQRPHDTMLAEPRYELSSTARASAGLW